MIRFVFVVLVFVLSACEPPVQERHVSEPDPVREEFVKVNRYMQRRHQDHIAAFVKRVGWNADVTPSGLWIVVEEKGTGPRIETGNRVSYTFTSTLLDGTPVYETAVDTPKQVVIGQGGMESGVEEGLRHLRNGSRAILLIPPYLAHGNFGDGNKIPGNSVLIYRLEIKEVR
jgi:FKBP-type peptidyl-prolyl cis-trans isomerase FkpA